MIKPQLLRRLSITTIVACICTTKFSSASIYAITDITSRPSNRPIIDVTAPSSRKPVSTEQIKQAVASVGYRPRVPNDLMVEHADPFSANTDEKRYQQLVAALHAHDSKIIWTLRGGYGAARLIPILDEHDFSKHPKLLVGFSDLTALFLYFDKKYGWPCIHGTIIGSVIDGKSTKQELDYLKKAIAGDWHKIKHSLKPANEAAKHTKINAKIIGGNLELIRSSLGTSWAIDARDKVLFIEEVDLRGYALHRSLLHLQQAGVFNGIKGLIIGDIICKPEPGSDKHLCEDALALFLKTIHVPIFRSNDFGHGNRNYALIFGADATISSDETIGHLTYSKKAS